CGVQHAAPRARGTSPALSAGGAGDLMSTADRARVQAIAARRRGAQPEDGYRIGPDDLLVVRIPGLFTAAGLTVSNALDGDSPAPQQQTDRGPFRQAARVSPSGEVSLPLLGPLQVEGRTARELERDIAARLVAVGAPPPRQVTVLIAEYRSGAVAVMGSVERPGLYPLTRPGARLADLIWAAGGPSKEAGRVVEFAPGAMQQDLTDNYLVATPEASTSTPVAAGVRTPPRPEPAPFPAHDLRIEPVTDSAPATPRPEPAPVTAHALWIEPAADGRRLTIPLSGVPDGLETFTLTDPPRLVIEVRDPGGPLHLDVQFILDAAGRGASLFNPEVRPGDVITVLPAGSFQVDGWVGRPGSYPVTRGLTCAGAVSAAGGYLFPADPHRVVVKRIIGAGEQRLFTVDLDAIAAGRAPDFPLADGDIIRVPAQTSLLVPWGVWSVVSAVGRVGVTALTF